MIVRIVKAPLSIFYEGCCFREMKVIVIGK